MFSTTAPSLTDESVGSPNVTFVPVTPPEDVTVVIESSTYFLVDASSSAAGAPTCTFDNVDAIAN